MRFLLAFLLISSLSTLHTQTCTGSLGDNIFTAGDFGSGLPNVLTPDPGIAPDYQYNTIPPPADGQYVVSNNTAAWSSLFPTWLAIEDNSDDPLGYMMIVNASFEPGLFYDQVIDGLCGNTLYEFSADIINLIEMGVAGHLEPNVSFLLDDVVQFSTGDIAATDQWETYGFTFTTDPGQTSVRLSLRNNAPGGIGNDLALDNISFRPCGDEAFILPNEPANICEDGQPLELFATILGSLYSDPVIQWQTSPDGINSWTDLPGETDSIYLHTQLSAGSYFYRYLIADGVDNLQNERCRLNSNVKQIIVLPKEHFIRDTICDGLEYLIGNSTYTTSGSYLDSLTNFLGCDSIVFTDLVVQPFPDLQPIFDTRSPECFDQATGTITVSSVVNGNPPYSFNWENGVSTSNVLADVLGNTSYDLSITDRFGCTLDTSIFLPAPGILTLDLGADQTIDLGATVTLTADADFTVAGYDWSSSLPDEMLPCSVTPDCPVISWIPTQNQTVFLTAIDSEGCTVTDSVFISVNPIYDLFAPNAFSPNRDGVNDVFTLYGRSERVREVTTFRVFNRWGQLVHEQLNFALGQADTSWNGDTDGRPTDQGIYVYVFEVVFIDGVTRTFSGDVMLLR